MESLSILVVDDEQRVLDEIKEFLQNRDYTVFTANSGSEAFKKLEKKSIDIVILDIKLPKISGLDVLKRIKEDHPEIEVIMISGHGDMETVIHAMRQGAIDYFPKPFRLIDINNSILRTQRFVDLNKKLKTAQTSVDLLSKKMREDINGRLIGQSSAIKNLKRMMAKVAATDDTSVLILGESGTGKELVAQGIHNLSNRSKNPFYSVNCSAIPESLFESEFFGHKKGSFTGAFEDKMGWFETANTGTLFLDEISDMPLLQQAKLLRVLEERKVSKIGSSKVIDVDVRVIAASNKKLEDMANENKFRLDLFHRLSIFVIEIPPLRERVEDIPVLMNYFLNHFTQKMNKGISKIDEKVFEIIKGNPIPGNVRQLRNCMERAVIMCEGDILLPEHFKMETDIYATSGNGAPNKNESFEILDLEENERKLIQIALKKANSNKSKAANLLNISWQSLDRRMKKFGLE